jgi:DHA1 family multidrug resistance protein-like MFS transporter
MVSEVVTSPSNEQEAGDAAPTSDGMHQVWLLAISLSLLQIGFGIVTPIFPYYISMLGVGGIELGTLAASFAMTRIVLAGPLGGLSDKVGRRPVLIAALLGFAIANLVYAAASNIVIMIGARAIEGAVSAGFFPAANAYVSDVTSIENRGTAMGYLSMGNMVGFIVGPALGGTLAQFTGYRFPFVVAAIATLATMVVVYVLVKEPVRIRAARADGDTRSRIPIREALSKARSIYGTLGVAMFANMFAMGILEVAFMLDAVVNFGIQPVEIGLFFGIIGVVMIVGNVGFGKLSDMKGRKWLIVTGAMVSGASLLMFILASNTVGFLLAGAILAAGMSMRGPTIQALIGDVTDPRSYGVVMGVFGAVSNSAYAVSSLLGGSLFDQMGNGDVGLLIAYEISLVGAGAAVLFLPSTLQPDHGEVVPAQVH